MSDDLTPLAGRTILVAGLGNIGSPLGAMLLQAGVTQLRLIDRDVIEPTNLAAQDYRPEDIGRPKADALCQRLRERFPDREVRAWSVDLAEMPVGLADADLILGALDSRRARQLLVGDIAWPLGVSVIDGGVGDGHLGRLQVFRPGPDTACLECTWGDADYRLLSREYPCRTGAAVASFPTGAPAYLGTFTASLMLREAARLLSGQGERESYEVAFDLDHLVLRRYALRRSARCRFDHKIRARTAGDDWENQSVPRASGSWTRPGGRTQP